MKYHESVLEDFTGFLFVDSRSNAFLNLTLVNVMGSVHGTISSINYTQVSIHKIKVQFPNSVPVTTLLDRLSKFRRQVKQARLPTITAVALGPSY